MAGGIEAIVRLINTQQPQAKVIVLVCLLESCRSRALRGSCVFSALCLCGAGSYGGDGGGQLFHLSSALCVHPLAWLCRSSAVSPSRCVVVLISSIAVPPLLKCSVRNRSELGFGSLSFLPGFNKSAGVPLFEEVSQSTQHITETL